MKKPKPLKQLASPRFGVPKWKSLNVSDLDQTALLSHFFLTRHLVQYAYRPGRYAQQAVGNSLRHMYATFKSSMAAPICISRGKWEFHAMMEHHYSHLIPRLHADKLAGLPSSHLIIPRFNRVFSSSPFCRHSTACFVTISH
jgi:hypothetical protein